MKITKFDQSCILIEKAGATLIIDPVEYETPLPEIENLEAVVITHQHSDHFQPEIIEKLRAKNPSAVIFNPLREETTTPNFNLKPFGGKHQAVFDGVEPIENVGVIIDDKIVHPGDSFDLPEKIEDYLLFPALLAPWCKASEVVDFINRSKASLVVPVHDSILSDLGKGFCRGGTSANANKKVKILEPGESIEF